MTELAAGAVSSLLLGGVKDDVQFIKEEMESMKSFLVHLARSTPPGGEHDEQVRTWMTQVRLLAQDCHNCIDLYLYSGNPHIHRAKGKLWRYFWWVYWFLRKLLAQHRAAVQLRQLKDRARDVGERRLRYGVEVPGKSTAGLAVTASSSARGGYEAAAGDDNEEEDGDNQLVSTRATSSRTLDDYVKAKLWEWGKSVPPNAGESLSMVTVAPYTYQDLLSLVQETLVSNPKGIGYECIILVDIPAVHPDFLPLRAKEVLFYILRELKNAKSQPQDQEQDQGSDHQGEGGKYVDHCEEVFRRKLQIYNEKKKALALLKIKENIKEMKVSEKLDKIKSDIQGRVGNRVLPKGYKLHGELDKLDLDVLLQLLLEAPVATSQQNQGENKDMQKLQARIAKKLKEHMEAEEKDKTLEKEKVTKYMELEGDEAPGKTMEEEDMVQGGGGEITDHMVEVEGEGEVTKHTAAAEEQGAGEIAEHMVEGKGKVTKPAVEEEAAAEGAGEISEHMEETEGGGGGGEEIESQHTTWIHLDEAQYARIMQNLFPKGSSSRPLQTRDRSLVGKQATKTTTATLGEDQIKQMIQDAKEDILWKLLEAKYDKSEATGGASGVPNQNPETKYDKSEEADGESGVPNQNPETISKKIGQMMDKMKREFRQQLKIKGLVDEIKNNLNYRSHLYRYECPLFILKVDKLMDVSTLEDTRNALSLLNCSADIMIVTTTKEDIQLAKEYCYPPREPIDYSLAGLYHDTVLDLITSQQQKNNGDNYYHPQIFHDILDDCEPHEFCMKIFTRALYANPKRSNDELLKLHSILRDSPTSFNSIAKVMFKFSYNDLPKEYKSCLLYLAIFPPGHKISRSTLIGRWVAEGLTSKEDWHSSVRQANRCFDALVDRSLVYPADIGATGNVKSCVVGEPIHGIITTIARKQHILETRLSHHLARHFSVFNDLQLRSSDRIDKFFQGLSRSSLSVLKVLDLEGCECFTGGKNQRYLKDICRKMLLLKYLSLRRTDITQLPREINNLRELEVLDIRQTKVPPHATASVLLLKLKRLLAGNTDWTPRPTLGAQELVSTAVQIPHKIEKMVNMQILSNVKARSSQHLKDIGKLWQLRKLGVVVDDDPSYLKNLLRAISDLHECLCSLSITLPTATSKATPSQESPEVPLKLKHQPKLLESLSISGTTQKGFLPLFVKDANNKLVKVTLSSTSLNKNNLEDLARLPKLQFIRLRHITDIESLVFKEEEFKYLKYLLVEGSSFTNISFMDGAACMLEKIVLSFTNLESVSGVEGLQKLEEVELTMSGMSSSDKKNNDTLLSSFNNCKQMAKLTVVGSHEQGDQQIQSMIDFNKGEFQKLRLLTVDCSAITKVVFTNGSAPKLEKIVWSSSTSLCGIDILPKLKEIEFNGDLVPKVVEEAIKNHKNKPSLKHNKPETQDQAKADEQEEDGDDHAAKFSLLCWKKQV